MQKRKKFVTAVVSNTAGEIFDLDGYAAVGMAGSSLVPLTSDDTIQIPFGGEFMLMPDRKPVLYNIKNHRIEILTENPYTPGESIFPVAAFNSPGYVVSFVSAFKENKNAGFLPLFSYGAVGWHNDKFRAAVIRVDRERRQDLRLMKAENIVAGIRKIQKECRTTGLQSTLKNAPWNTAVRLPRIFFWEDTRHRFRHPNIVMHTALAVCRFKQTVKFHTARTESISNHLLKKLLKSHFVTSSELSKAL